MNREALNSLAFLAQGFRRASEHGERGVVHGDDVLHAEKADGVRSFARAHGEEIADGKHGELRFVEFADELHVAEEGGVSRVIESDAAGKANDVAAGFAGLDADTVVVERTGMKGVGHGELKGPSLCVPPLLMGAMSLPRPLFASHMQISKMATILG